MLEVIVKVHLSASGLGSQDVLTLWHVPSPVHLSLVINLNIQTDSSLLLGSNSIACLSFLIQSVIAVIFSVLR